MRHVVVRGLYPKPALPGMGLRAQHGVTARRDAGVAHREFVSGLIWGLMPMVAAVVLALGSVALRP